MYPMHIFPRQTLLSRRQKTHMCGRTRADKIGIGAGGDIVVATSRTQVCCTHTHRQNRYRRLQGGQFRE